MTKRSTQIIFSLILSATVFLASSEKIFAHSIQPSITEIEVETGESFKGFVKFTNTETKTIDIKISTENYLPQEGEIAAGTIFVKTEKSSFRIGIDQTVKIPYTVSIPETTIPGSYFNVIVFEETTDHSTDESPIGVNSGLGALLAIHALSPIEDTKKTLHRDLDTSLKIITKGIPFLSPLKFSLTVTNPTNFAITPYSDIRVNNAKGGKEPVELTLNAKGEKLYPGKSISKEFEVNSRSLYDFISPRTIVARTYTNMSNNFVEISKSVSNTDLLLVIPILAIILIVIFRSAKKIKPKKKKSRKG